MCICLSIKRSQALGRLSSPLAFGADCHVCHFQASYLLQFFFVLYQIVQTCCHDDTRMLLPSLNKISTIEHNILAIKQKLTKRGN